MVEAPQKRSLGDRGWDVADKTARELAKAGIATSGAFALVASIADEPRMAVNAVISMSLFSGAKWLAEQNLQKYSIQPVDDVQSTLEVIDRQLAVDVAPSDKVHVTERRQRALDRLRGRLEAEKKNLEILQDQKNAPMVIDVGRIIYHATFGNVRNEAEEIQKAISHLNQHNEIPAVQRLVGIIEASLKTAEEQRDPGALNQAILDNTILHEINQLQASEIQIKIDKVKLGFRQN